MRILGFGTARADFHLYTPGHPQQGAEIKLNDAHIGVGGSVVNTALVLNQLGSQSILVTHFGTDRLGRLIYDDLIRTGIDLITPKGLSTKTAFTMIIVDPSGERTMYSYDPQTITIDVSDKANIAMTNSDAFFTSCYEFSDFTIVAINQLLDICVVHNKLTFLDLSPLTDLIPEKTWKTLLPKFSILTGTEREFDILLKILHIDSLEILIQEYSLLKVYIKMGKQGSCFLTNNGEKHMEHVSCVLMKNSSGCGDAYNAGIIWGELNGKNSKQTIKLGNYLGTEVAKAGFNPGIITIGFEDMVNNLNDK